MAKIKIFVSEAVDYYIFKKYHVNEIQKNSISTFDVLIKFTDSITGNCFLFLPENGMHLCQQQILIERILENKNINLLNIFTHSPSIFGRGWGDKIIFLDFLSDSELNKEIDC